MKVRDGQGFISKIPRDVPQTLSKENLMDTILRLFARKQSKIYEHDLSSQKRRFVILDELYKNYPKAFLLCLVFEYIPFDEESTLSEKERTVYFLLQLRIGYYLIFIRSNVYSEICTMMKNYYQVGKLKSVKKLRLK
jgi:hypothetical protein